MTATIAIPTSHDRRTSEDLGLWEPKRALTLEAARAHTQRIQLFRRLLIIASVVLVGVLIWQFLADRGGEAFENDPSESVKMVNPRYSGRTADGLPFFLTADTATRRMVDRSTVELVKPVLEFIRNEAVQSSFVIARDGVYNDMDKVLELQTDVKLETDDGNVCDTTHARMFNIEKRIEGDKPIMCEGNFGTVGGQTYAIEDAYQTFIFTNGMTAKLNRNTRAKDDQDSFGFGGDGPVDVQAETGVYQGDRTKLSGNVVVVQDGAVITSNAMDILRVQKAGSDTGSIKLGAIQRIDAIGDFQYKTVENDIRGQRGVYELEKNRMTVTGDVVVVQPGGNRVEAQKLTYDTKTGTIRFSGSCLGRDCDTDGRTKTVLPGSRN